MSVELITGHAGTPHVTPAQQATLTAATIGQDDYILLLPGADAVNPIQATLLDSTHVKVSTGYGVNHGYEWQIMADETVILQPGSQGVNRNDLIVVERSMDANGIDSAVLKVLVGTSSAGAAADPATTETQHVLFRVPISGTNVTSPVKLYQVQPSSLVELQAKDTVHDSQIAALQTEDSTLDGKIATAQSQLNSSILQLNTRLTAAESKNTTQDSSISALNTLTTSHTSQISALTTKNTTQDSNISALQTKTASHDSSISAMQTKDSTLDTRITTVQSQLSTSISQLSTQLTTAYSKFFRDVYIPGAFTIAASQWVLVHQVTVPNAGIYVINQVQSAGNITSSTPTSIYVGATVNSTAVSQATLGAATLFDNPNILMATGTTAVCAVGSACVPLKAGDVVRFYAYRYLAGTIAAGLSSQCVVQQVA
jgi:uncharacterized coiled-coil protein SlyX